jgi:hypothetical protein
VLGAELLDSTDAAEYVRRMAPFIPVEPKAWGIHNYEDINHFRTTGTDAILKVTKSKIWLTEAAGLVRYVDGSGNVLYPDDERFAARATSYLFDCVQAHPDRIARVYYPRGATARRTTIASIPLSCAATAARARSMTSWRRGWRSCCRASPACARRRPWRVSHSRLRCWTPPALDAAWAARRPTALRTGPNPRCSGRLEVRWTGHSKPFGKRRFSLRAGKSSRYALRVGPRTRPKLARKRSSGKVMLVVALTRPSKLTRTYRRLRIVGNRQRPATRPGG